MRAPGRAFPAAPGRGYSGATPTQRRRRLRLGSALDPPYGLAAPHLGHPVSYAEAARVRCAFHLRRRQPAPDVTMATWPMRSRMRKVQGAPPFPGARKSWVASGCVKAVCDGRATATGERAWSTHKRNGLDALLRLVFRAGQGMEETPRTTQADTVTVAGCARRVPDRNGPFVSIDQPRRAGVRSSNLGCGLAAGCWKGGVPCALSCFVSSWRSSYRWP